MAETLAASRAEVNSIAPREHGGGHDRPRGPRPGGGGGRDRGPRR